ncbi:dihydropteroate synthase [Leucobacter sp. W1478]|uniref:dihydropteroate synthase n=1 Tax=Leucobacter sp. W1478 TaxID=3439065 RepID=UPI003F3A311C
MTTVLSLVAEPTPTRRFQVLGVINVTPDSFSDGGDYFDPEAAIARGRLLAAQGADIVDVGGESTRPGAVPVESAEELRRVRSVIQALSAEGIRVSVDTIHSATAREAVIAGATMINDVSGGLADADMYRVAAESDAKLILGHWRGVPDPSHRRSQYVDVVTEVRDELARLADAAIAAGVDPKRIVIDPCLGFDKTAEQGWALLRGLGRLEELGFPVLVGISRKRMLGELLAALPGSSAGATATERDLVTAVVSAFAARAGAWGVRVHDVPGTVQALAVERAWAQADPPRSRAGVVSHAGFAAGEARESAHSNGEELGAGPVSPSAHVRDRITLTGLEVFAHHGVFGFEREQGQRFIIDAELTVDLDSAARSDDLTHTVHYGEVAAAIAEAVRRDPVDLIETVADRAAGVALAFPGVRSARITVHKPDAPIAERFSDVSVTVVRDSVGGGA